MRYILNKKYQIHDDDNLTAPDVLKYQTHITYKQLQKSFLDYDSDDDSVDDFETISNRCISFHFNKIYEKLIF